MKKILLILCLFSMTAHAQWKYETTTTNLSNNYDSYLDYSKIRTEGRYKSIWDLKDYKSPETEASGKQYKSVVLKNIVDCQASKFQIAALYFYSEQMGKGAVVDSANYQVLESNWTYLACEIAIFSH